MGSLRASPTGSVSSSASVKEANTFENQLPMDSATSSLCNRVRKPERSFGKEAVEERLAIRPPVGPPRPPALPTTSPEAAPSCRPPWKPWPELELPPPWVPVTWCRQPWPPPPSPRRARPYLPDPAARRALLIGAPLSGALLACSPAPASLQLWTVSSPAIQWAKGSDS